MLEQMGRQSVRTIHAFVIYLPSFQFPPYDVDVPYVGIHRLFLPLILDLEGQAGQYHLPLRQTLDRSRHVLPAPPLRTSGSVSSVATSDVGDTEEPTPTSTILKQHTSMPSNWRLSVSGIMPGTVTSIGLFKCVDVNVCLFRG